MRFLLLATSMLAVLAPSAEAVKAKKCPNGRFVVDGPELVPTGGIASRFDAIGLDGKRVSIESGCEAVRAKLVRTRRGTNLRARWRTCGDAARVVLRARIDKDCLGLEGTLKAKAIPPKSFVALFETPPPAELNDGAPVSQPIADCGDAPTLDAVEALCSILGAAPCVSQTNTCSREQRQLFAGTRLASTPTAPVRWNGRGGSGDLMADAVLCSLRALSPELEGPIVSTPTAVSLGLLGDITVSQEVGFRSFDRLRERFEGYRRVVVDMPIVGKTQAITQNLVLDQTALTGGGFTAGSYPIKYAYALNVDTEDKEKILAFTPPGFTVPTPFGAVSVTPEFTYGTRTALVAAPYSGGNQANDVASLFESADWTVRLFDLYGINPGLANTATPATPGNFSNARSGWASQLGFGTRAGVLGQTPWVPPAGRIDRPDGDLIFPRSPTEAVPSVYVSASAEVAWPENPFDILPSWVQKIPFLNAPTARLTVKPTVQAGIASQLFVALSEGADHRATTEFEFKSRRLSSMTLLAGAGTVGLFTVEAGVRVSVTAEFPFPIGEKTFVDIDKSIPFPLAGDTAQGNVDVAAATSFSDVAPDFPETLDGIKSFKNLYVGAAAADAFIEQCYAPQELAEQPLPDPEPVPGEPADLFEGVLWPCNICINTSGHPSFDLTTLKTQYEQQLPSHPGWPPWPPEIPAHWVQVLAPAATPPVWKCNNYFDTGCYDLCTFNPATSVLTVALGPEQIVPFLPPDAKYDDERALLPLCDYDPPA
jgi:hypothetical protein